MKKAAVLHRASKSFPTTASSGCFVRSTVRFSVNLYVVDRVHLTISAQLLKVAMSVKGRLLEGGAP